MSDDTSRDEGQSGDAEPRRFSAKPTASGPWGGVNPESMTIPVVTQRPAWDRAEPVVAEPVVFEPLAESLQDEGPDGFPSVAPEFDEPDDDPISAWRPQGSREEVDYATPARGIPVQSSDVGVSAYLRADATETALTHESAGEAAAAAASASAAADDAAPQKINSRSEGKPQPPEGPHAGDLVNARQVRRAKPRAQSGWRAALGLGPGKAELLRASRIERVARPLDGRKTIMVINTKGGGGKTLVTLMLATYLGRYRSGSVLAWDNNETEGTLGMRAPKAPHHRTVVDLLGALPRITEDATAGPSELGHYVREQRGLNFDILASADDDEAMRIIEMDEFEELHKQLSRFYRMIVVDTGNNRLSANWRAAAAKADMLVFATSLKDDVSVVAAKNLDALVAAGREDLVRNAVCVISHTSAKGDPSAGVHTREHFEQWVRRVVDIPYDRALAPGLQIDPMKIDQVTDDACLEMAAAVVDGL